MKKWRKKERKRKEGIDYTGVTGRQHKALQNHPLESPVLFLSLSLCGPLFTGFAPDKINRVSVINSLLSHRDCSSVICVCVHMCKCAVQSNIAAYIWCPRVQGNNRRGSEEGSGENAKDKRRRRGGVKKRGETKGRSREWTEEEVKETRHRASKEKTMGESEGLAQRLWNYLIFIL